MPSPQVTMWNVQHAGHQFEIRMNVRCQCNATLKSAPLSPLHHHTDKFTHIPCVKRNRACQPTATLSNDMPSHTPWFHHCHHLCQHHHCRDCHVDAKAHQRNASQRVRSHHVSSPNAMRCHQLPFDTKAQHRQQAPTSTNKQIESINHSRLDFNHCHCLCVCEPWDTRNAKEQQTLPLLC